MTDNQNNNLQTAALHGGDLGPLLAQCPLPWSPEVIAGIARRTITRTQIPDTPQALAVLEAKADAGEPLANCILGHVFLVGHGTPVNLTAAADRFLDAARRGQDGAQFMIGLCFFIGLGVRQNHTLAYFWLSVAARWSPEQGQRVLQQQAQQYIWPQDLPEIHRQVEAWRPRPHPPDSIGAATKH